MNVGPEWFAPKRFGYGSGLPIAWQGWAVLLAYALFMVVSGLLFAERPLIFLPLVGFATILLLFVAKWTTKGGWKWRGVSGDRD